MTLRRGTNWSLGWLWVVVLLVLPNCSLDRRGLGGGHVGYGPVPHSSAIFCDIERKGERHCPASPEELASAVRRAAAAVALNEGQTSGVGIDESPEALARCGGTPELVPFHGPFPEGLAVCLNCSVIPSLHPTANAVCVAKCEDLVGGTADDIAYCESHAHVSTNFPVDGCFPDACPTGGGMLNPDFADPRRPPEPVDWNMASQIGVSVTGNTITRTAATTTSFDAGAVSTQWITRGDAYVEFSAGETNRSHLIGFSDVPTGCLTPASCPDTDPSLSDVRFAISLNSDGNVYVIEAGGTTIIGPLFGYGAGDRFRVTLTDRFDSPRTITYSRVTGTCAPGRPCAVTPFHMAALGPPGYPLRVNALFRESGATLTDVRLVHIQ